MTEIKKIVANIFSLEGNDRTVKAKKNIFYLLFLNVFNFLFIMAAVPFTLKYLGAAEYGIWLTLSSLLTWLSYLDFGIGNGLRNKLAESLAHNDITKSKIYVSTSYVIFSAFILVLWIVFAAVFSFLPWNTILNVSTDFQENLYLLVLLLFILFSSQFVLKLIYSIIAAVQKPAINGLISVFVNFLTLILIILLKEFSAPSLFYIGIGSSLIPILIYFISTYLFFSKENRAFAPSIKYYRKEYSRELVSLGFQFFIIQLAVLILYSTHNIIIIQLFSPSDVTTYNIAYKYMFLNVMVFNIISTPLWSAYTEAFVKQEYEWIKISIKKMIFVWGLFTLGAFVMILLSSWVYSFWIGKGTAIPLDLTIWLGVFVILINWYNIFVYFINGSGKIRMQFYYAIFLIIVSVPASILFTRLTNNISGVVIGTNICILIGGFYAPLQYYKIINRKASGNWNK
ncbi:MAG: lipopolysaccharide biosynthesis protein [Syntrophothermus sp.]